ncbi:hypothetical protein FCM35_KLT12697 [Carex littledalei]|uniref:Uncharacterized protein n=1 Tax=Carex littledalei TaxID=544730 RepID=A0A833VH03_9POAL|nr:hypothetical protein FCM35_KLT12697 [Carex littledalei]
MVIITRVIEKACGLDTDSRFVVIIKGEEMIKVGRDRLEGMKERERERREERGECRGGGGEWGIELTEGARRLHRSHMSGR